jgi:hypothetical protein
MTATTAAKVTVKHLDPADAAALHCHYEGQTSAQDCFVELDTRDGELTADYDANIGGGYPASVYHRLVLRWTVPTLTAQAANELLDELAPLAARVLAGAEQEWDGNNIVGTLGADARDAADEIAARCEALTEDHGIDADVVGETDAYDWWVGGDTLPESLTAETTDTQLAELAADAEREALNSSDQPLVLTGALEYLTGKRDEMRDDA